MVLLIQFRTDQSGPHEIQCVYDSFPDEFPNLEIVNAKSNHITTEDLQAHAQDARAVLLGGCGENGYETNEPEKLERLKQKIEPVISQLLATDTPTLGLCFGHQLVADIAGGVVGTPEDQSETGIAEMALTKHGRSDPIFSALPSSFHAVVGHKASVTKKPENALHLAESNHHSLQALRYGSNVYTCQFHPELEAGDLFDRLQMYPEYTKHEIPYDRDTTLEARQIIDTFFATYA